MDTCRGKQAPWWQMGVVTTEGIQYGHLQGLAGPEVADGI